MAGNNRSAYDLRQDTRWGRNVASFGRERGHTAGDVGRAGVEPLPQARPVYRRASRDASVNPHSPYRPPSFGSNGLYSTASSLRPSSSPSLSSHVNPHTPYVPPSSHRPGRPPSPSECSVAFGHSTTSPSLPPSSRALVRPPIDRHRQLADIQLFERCLKQRLNAVSRRRRLYVILTFALSIVLVALVCMYAHFPVYLADALLWFASLFHSLCRVVVPFKEQTATGVCQFLHRSLLANLGNLILLGLVSLVILLAMIRREVSVGQTCFSDRCNAVLSRFNIYFNMQDYKLFIRPRSDEQ